MTWRHRTLASAEDLDQWPPSLDPDAAQPWCNFILWWPDEPVPGLRSTPGTLRKEAPPGVPSRPTAGRTPWSANNPAAHRFELTDGTRRLRVKQFLYDWAFPALDHPCLWQSETRAVPLDDEHVLWLGVDYIGNAAASARLGRTTVELSVLDGQFEDAEIAAVYRSLAPVDDDAARQIAATPLAELSYWARQPEASAVRVPVGLWAFHRPSDHRRAWRPDVAAPLGLPDTLAGLPVDSVGTFTRPDGREETEVVYSGGRLRGREIRVIAQRPQQGGISVPAKPDKHPGTFDQVDVDGVPVQLAWIDARHGPFHAVLATGALELMVLAGTSVHLDRDAFLGAIRELTR
ncbi:hypothetical protein O7607_23650 [Micromonospora sp. WMMA1949]|uniref:hypothetical protein n=1 Tax=Micromonospora sp. WMMA1949 TaxID=3015162 RepID=UPI0022B61F76|nr:hypothetical protein [Micromonospora sp. WMMA1949]MCZ7428745.1 hypothetical protein [Micromonospora sp. WMMA1949]